MSGVRFPHRPQNSMKKTGHINKIPVFAKVFLAIVFLAFGYTLIRTIPFSKTCENLGGEYVYGYRSIGSGCYVNEEIYNLSKQEFTNIESEHTLDGRLFRIIVND